MIVIVLLGLLACTSAAPGYGHHHHHHHHHPHHHHGARSHYEDDCNMDSYLDRFCDSETFDIPRFWNELNREMISLDLILADVHKRYPCNEPSVQIDDKKYIITLRLQGFDEKEIIVKAKKGLLVLQAFHKVAREPESNYFDIRTLPENVGENGSWIYENGLLRIVFPIFPITQVEKEIPTQTTAPDHSCEEDTNEGIDERTAHVDQTVWPTNEIPLQENTAKTTYGLNDDVGLFPMPTYF